MEKRYLNLDAAQSVFFDRQLEYVKTQVYPVLYPELKARQFIPVDSSAGDGIDRIVTRQEDDFGAAKLISDYGADLPRADTKSEEVSQKVRDIGVAFGYSIREIRAASRAGVPLEARKARAARKAAELTLDQIAASGDSAAGLKGFLNHSDVTPAASHNNTAWTSASDPADILEDINEAVADMRDATKGIHSPTTLLLPEAQFTVISQMRVNTVSDATVLKFLLSTSPWLKEVMPWYRLDGAGTTGSTDDRMVLYERNPDVLELAIPVEFEMMEPQLRGLEYVVPCRMVTAGVLLHRPGAVVFRDGI